MKHPVILIAAVNLILLWGCKPKPETKDDILSSHKWSYHEISFNEKRTDATAMGNPVVAFRSDKTYMLEYGPMADSGTWQITGDTLFSTISKVSNNQSQALSILQLTHDTFRVQSVTDSNVLTLTMVPYKEAEQEAEAKK